MSRHPLPPDLSATTFTVDEGLHAGVSRNRLRAHDLDASVWGVRAPRSDDSVARRAGMFAARLRTDAFFSHSTAALLMGAPLPLELERETSVHVSVAAPHRAPHATGIIGHKLHIAGSDVVTTQGLRHTSAARTWCDLAQQLEILDLVAVGDYLIHWRLPLTTVAALVETLDRHPGRRGRARAIDALSLLNNRAESRPESRMRVLLAWHGIPDPQINHVIVDTDAGTFLRTDFAIRQYRLLLEYQGDYHRLKVGQWRKDMTRRSRLQALGWVVMELNADDLRDPDELAARIRATIDLQVSRGVTPL